MLRAAVTIMLCGAFVAMVAVAVPRAALAMEIVAVERPAARPNRLAVRTGERHQSAQLPPPILYPESPCRFIVDEPIESINPTRSPHELRIVGTSVRGRPIFAERWGSASSGRDVVIVGQTHGNECAVIHALQTLRAFDLSVRLWLIPTLNPDGMLALDRRNANGVDLNADGSDVSQPETQALRNLVAELRPELVVFLHSPNGFAGAHPGGGAGSHACFAVTRAGIRCAGGGAGTRPYGRWFLWQMTRAVSPSTDSVLVEFFAISHREVTNAHPRPPHRPASSAVAVSNALLDTLR